MGLEDKFYPEGGPLTKFDNMMIKSFGKVGEFYQNMTGNESEDLVKKLYGFSHSGFVLGYAALRPSSFLITSIAGKLKENPIIQSPLEEENRLEFEGMHKTGLKLARASFFFVTPAIMYMSGKSLNLAYGNDEFLYYYMGLGGILESISMVAFNTAEYMSKANIPKPPKKTIPEKLKETFRLKEVEI